MIGEKENGVRFFPLDSSPCKQQNLVEMQSRADRTMTTWETGPTLTAAFTASLWLEFFKVVRGVLFSDFGTGVVSDFTLSSLDLLRDDLRTGARDASASTSTFLFTMMIVESY